ncbi:glycine-rich RNA-binding protein 4, mitochondrial-like [Nicotiana tabacum]|uniref:Glycine-rich RNA-binding protein 4, mitochondrial-like n=2 Tax=Nicotiana TaxID=4085 RepID=A0A1S3YRH3_TOBAC|nr:PREDICTED: glycine-rich RNA-binding protein 4, mitochondrial [Nicotiana sylvestris]XP_016454816.1 PREDICTED: glycine-rich RNA-binding protein 4, mitochondrial-like [Nicotiana tabacum]
MKESLIQFSRRVVRLPNILNGRLYCSRPSASSLPPNNKLFVAGLSWSVDEKSLNDAFSSFGQVTEVRIMYDKETGRSRGFGFVHFSKDEEANCAKDAMDGKAFLGRPLRVSFALEKVRGAPVVVPRLTGVGNGDNKTR